MIDLQNLVLTFPDGNTRITAVNNVSLTVPDGTVTGITGPSGSGKSSLLAMASSLILPDSGEVFIDGVKTSSLDMKGNTALRAEKIGIIFQQPNLIPSLTAVEQIYAVAASEGISRAERKELHKEAVKLLEVVGLASQQDKRPHQLSGGQKQRINIARALIKKPSALIVDEPTSALDKTRGEEIIDLIMKLTKEYGTATLLVTHDQTHLPLMDEVHIMVDGSFTS